MINSHFEVVANPRIGTDAVEVYFVSRNGTAPSIIHFDQEGYTHVDDIKAGVEQKPTMIIPRSYYEELVRALSNDLPNINRDVVNAELSATKYHLEDMRRLVLNSKEVIDDKRS